MVANLAGGRLDPDRAVAAVANMLLGGVFTSRLNQNLRERNGYSYGAASRLVRLSGAGLFSAGAAVRTDVTGESVKEILSELTRLRGEAVSAADLIKGKKSLQQRLVSQCERPEGLAQVFADLARSGLPLDELSRLLTAAQASTSASLQQVVGPLLDPQRLTVVVVGDLKKVEAAVRKQLGAVWRQLMGSHYPAMSMIFVSDLLDHPGKIELEATAAVPAA